MPASGAHFFSSWHRARAGSMAREQRGGRSRMTACRRARRPFDTARSRAPCRHAEGPGYRPRHRWACSCRGSTRRPACTPPHWPTRAPRPGRGGSTGDLRGRHRRGRSPAHTARTSWRPRLWPRGPRPPTTDHGLRLRLCFHRRQTHCTRRTPHPNRGSSTWGWSKRSRGPARSRRGTKPTSQGR